MAAAAANPGVQHIERELLSAHSTEAVFEGSRDFPCRHRTSLCPQHCGHGGMVAEFRVAEYLAYEKLGKYGDEKATVFHQRLSEAPPHVAAVIASLARGDRVRLDWHHDYVSTTWVGGGESKSPERPIVRIEKLEPAAAAAGAATA